MPGDQESGDDKEHVDYLWHWPLIVAAPWVLHRSTSRVAKLAILAASLVLALLTKRCIEDPVRTDRRWKSRRWPAYAFAVAGMTAFLAVTSSSYVHIPAISKTVAAEAREQTRALVVSGARSCFGAAAMVPANRCGRPFARPAGLDTAFAASDGSGMHRQIPRVIRSMRDGQVVGRDLQPMTALAQRNPQLVSYLPLTQFFCDASKCHGLIGGVVVYFDSHHLTTTYWRSLARYLGAEVAGVLTKPQATESVHPRV